MGSEVVDIRERIERVRAEMAGEVVENEHDDLLTKDLPSNENFNNLNIDKNVLPDFKLTVQNPVSPKMLLFLIIMQLFTSIALVLVIYFK
tara:strand:- start:429 stop:698 length:270 start_codon:yes stop_codon:yes gene_type:complete